MLGLILEALKQRYDQVELHVKLIHGVLPIEDGLVNLLNVLLHLLVAFEDPACADIRLWPVQLDVSVPGLHDDPLLLGDLVVLVVHLEDLDLVGVDLRVGVGVEHRDQLLHLLQVLLVEGDILLCLGILANVQRRVVFAWNSIDLWNLLDLLLNLPQLLRRFDARLRVERLLT